MSVILHIDFDSYFATLEQQANPRLRGKPVGVTGGDRMERTVLSTASVEAKRLGVKTGMQIWEAKKVCPQIVIVQGDADKYLYCSRKFWNILKDYSPLVEIFSIDEAFLELPRSGSCRLTAPSDVLADAAGARWGAPFATTTALKSSASLAVAKEIKKRIKNEIGEWITCSVGISYNKLMAKLASSLQKPDGLVIIADQETAIIVLDNTQLDDVCGIGPRIKKRLFNMGITNFRLLRQVPKELLVASFKSYGEILFNMSRGIDESPIATFYEKEEVKSIGQRHTLDHDTDNPEEIRRVLFKICEMVAARVRVKNMVGGTVHCWYRPTFSSHFVQSGAGKQRAISPIANDGSQICKVAWKIFNEIWNGEKIRMIGASVSGLKPDKPLNLSLFPQVRRQEIVLKTMDNINGKFGDFTLQRGTFLDSVPIQRKPNPYLSDRRFKL